MLKIVINDVKDYVKHNIIDNVKDNGKDDVDNINEDIRT